MSCRSAWTIAVIFQSFAAMSFAATNSASGAPPPEQLAEIGEFVQDSKLTLLSAVIAARDECRSGTPVHAGISRHYSKHAFEILFLAEDHKRVIRVEIDVICGEVLAVDDEPMTPKEIAKLVALAGNRLDRLEAALKRATNVKQGAAVAADLRERKNAPPIVAVTMLMPTGFSERLIDGTDDETINLVRRGE